MPKTNLPVFGFGSPSWCTYCGDPASSRDHVIAVSYQKIDTKHARNTLCGPWCWCCKNCNPMLGNRWFDSFKSRCVWVQWRLEKKVKPVIWNQSEINQLGHGLKEFVRDDVKRRLHRRARADYYESPEFYQGIEALLWETKRIEPNCTENRFILSYFSSILPDITQALYGRR